MGAQGPVQPAAIEWMLQDAGLVGGLGGFLLRTGSRSISDMPSCEEKCCAYGRRPRIGREDAGCLVLAGLPQASEPVQGPQLRVDGRGIGVLENEGRGDIQVPDALGGTALVPGPLDGPVFSMVFDGLVLEEFL